MGSIGWVTSRTFVAVQVVWLIHTVGSTGTRVVPYEILLSGATKVLHLVTQISYLIIIYGVNLVGFA